jgi:outer membrane protein
LIFTKVCRIKTHLEEQFSIVAAKYQLLKMQEDIALNANAFASTFNKENLKVQTDQRVLIKSKLSVLRN